MDWPELTAKQVFDLAAETNVEWMEVDDLDSHDPEVVVSVGRHPSSARFHEILYELGALHDEKSKGYGTAVDPLANVRGSEEWGVAPWVGAMVRANDKIRRLQAFAQKGELPFEAVEDAFLDLAVYAVIGLILYEQGHALILYEQGHAPGTRPA